VNVIGKTLTVFSSTDPTKVGRSGRVVLETAKTLTLESGPKTLVVEKRGSVFSVSGSKTVLSGEDIAGRLEDRLGRGQR
jgi:RNase P/RNase MRP subunit p29